MPCQTMVNINIASGKHSQLKQEEPPKHTICFIKQEGEEVGVIQLVCLKLQTQDDSQFLVQSLDFHLTLCRQSGGPMLWVKPKLPSVGAEWNSQAQYRAWRQEDVKIDS